jgi:hypothetical protein
VREAYLSTFFTTPDFSFDDTYAIWTLTELAVGILAACLPVLRPLFTFVLGKARSGASGGLGNGAVNRSRGVGRHGYYARNGNEAFKLSSVPSSTARSALTSYHPAIEREDTYGVGGVNVTTVGLGTGSGGAEIMRTRGTYGRIGSDGGDSGVPARRFEQSVETGSEENILPRFPSQIYDYDRREAKMGIMKTTEVHVT